jgi:hypothetical protein
MAKKAKIQRSGKTKWMVMVYMAGDNNLDGAAHGPVMIFKQPNTIATITRLIANVRHRSNFMP